MDFLWFFNNDSKFLFSLLIIAKKLIYMYILLKMNLSNVINFVTDIVK